MTDDDDRWVDTLTREDAVNLLTSWEVSADRHARILTRIRATAGQPEPEPIPPPAYAPQVLLIWTEDWDALKDAMNPILSLLVSAGLIRDADPEGASEGWEWRRT